MICQLLWFYVALSTAALPVEPGELCDVKRLWCFIGLLHVHTLLVPMLLSGNTACALWISARHDIVHAYYYKCTYSAVIVKELTLGNLESALIDVPLTLSVTSSLGRALQVPDNKIIEFQTNFPRDIRYVRTEILHYWLENSMCTWDAITGALYTIGERNIAEKIRSKFVSTWALTVGLLY